MSKRSSVAITIREGQNVDENDILDRQSSPLSTLEKNCLRNMRLQCPRQYALDQEHRFLLKFDHSNRTFPIEGIWLDLSPNDLPYPRTYVHRATKRSWNFYMGMERFFMKSYTLFKVIAGAFKARILWNLFESRVEQEYLESLPPIIAGTLVRLHALHIGMQSAHVVENKQDCVSLTVNATDALNGRVSRI